MRAFIRRTNVLVDLVCIEVLIGVEPIARLLTTLRTANDRLR